MPRRYGAVPEGWVDGGVPSCAVDLVEYIVASSAILLCCDLGGRHGEGVWMS